MTYFSDYNISFRSKSGFYTEGGKRQRFRLLPLIFFLYFFKIKAKFVFVSLINTFYLCDITQSKC